jgi:hypothetical protein
MRAQIGPLPNALEVSPFYKKYVDAQGIPVISSERVPDDALLVARDIIISMLSNRPDIRRKMIERRWRTGVIAETEMTSEIPEYARMKRPGAPAGEPVNQADRDYHAWRSRGLGGNPTTGAEENLLGYPGTRYYGEHIFVHEFAHAIMSSLRAIEPDTGAAIQAAYDDAKAAGKYMLASNGRPHYAMTNAGIGIGAVDFPRSIDRGGLGVAGAITADRDRRGSGPPRFGLCSGTNSGHRRVLRPGSCGAGNEKRSPVDTQAGQCRLQSTNDRMASRRSGRHSSRSVHGAHDFSGTPGSRPLCRSDGRSGL